MHPVTDLIAHVLGALLERYGIIDPWTPLPADVQELIAHHLDSIRRSTFLGSTGASTEVDGEERSPPSVGGNQHPLTQEREIGQGPSGSDSGEGAGGATS